MARRNYRCFDRYTDEHQYGICAGTNLHSSCEKEALRVLKKMLERHAQLTWNIRDTHMCDCLQDLIQHHGHGTKAIVWISEVLI